MEDESKKRKSEGEPLGSAETIRKSGLAYAAGISLVGSVVVMLGFGWAVDSFFDSSPVGTVTGIIIGAVVGFYQFFRITARISGD